MNFSLSLHKAVLDLVPSRGRYPSPAHLTHSSRLILGGRSSPSRRRLHRNHDCEPARSEERPDKKEWVSPQRRLTSTHPVLSDRCGATAPLPFDRQPLG